MCWILVIWSTQPLIHRLGACLMRSCVTRAPYQHLCQNRHTVKCRLPKLLGIPEGPSSWPANKSIGRPPSAPAEAGRWLPQLNRVRACANLLIWEMPHHLKGHLASPYQKHQPRPSSRQLVAPRLHTPCTRCSSTMDGTLTQTCAGCLGCSS